jgi:hypothetical protein
MVVYGCVEYVGWSCNVEATFFVQVRSFSLPFAGGLRENVSSIQCRQPFAIRQVLDKSAEREEGEERSEEVR